MRKINNIFVHISDTAPTTRPEAILTFCRTPVANAHTGATHPYIPGVQGGYGWINPPYHYMIDNHACRHHTHPHHRVANGVRGHNADSLHVCVIGRLDPKGRLGITINPLQEAELKLTIQELHDQYPLADILGHRDVLTPGTPGWKACPGFDVRTWLPSFLITHKNSKK